jgi:HSP20 family protein
MSMRDLIPWGRHERSASLPASFGGSDVSPFDVSPFLTLHREMNRLFDDVFSRFDGAMPSLFDRLSNPMAANSMATWPSVEIAETDTELRVSAELPGMSESDVDVSIGDDMLVIRGEKRAETEDTARQFSERSYGRFERRIPLPFEVDDGKAQASFQNGVLTVTLPKSPKAEARMKRIAINGKANGKTKHA